MSADSIQKKIFNAHKKIGKLMGHDFGIYRPTNSNIDVISDRNLIKYVKASATLNDNYSTNIKWEVPVWTLYTESAVLQPGDYIYSEHENRTFFVLIMQPHMPVLAIEANDRIDIRNVGYADNGDGFSPQQTTYIAKNLPCFLSYSTSTSPVNLPGNGVGSVPFRTMQIHTALPKQKMLLGETLIDTAGFTGDIIGYDYNSVGVGVRMHAAERGFPSGS